MKIIRVSNDISLKVYTRKDGYAVGAIELRSKNNAWLNSETRRGGVVLMPDELEKLIAGLKETQGEFARKATPK